MSDSTYKVPYHARNECLKEKLLRYYFGWVVPDLLMTAYKAVTIAFTKILNEVGKLILREFLGPEESCTGDPARRAGNAIPISDAGHEQYSGFGWL